MSLDPEQIDAYTIAIEQELMDEEFVSSDYTALISDALADLSTEDKQAELLKIAADIGLLFSGVLLKSKEEAEAKRREKMRLEQERADREAEEARVRQEERRRVREENRERERQERIARGENPDACFCGIPSCNYVRDGGSNPNATYVPAPLASSVLPAWEQELLRPTQEPTYYQRPVFTASTDEYPQPFTRLNATVDYRQYIEQTNRFTERLSSAPRDEAAAWGLGDPVEGL